MEEPTSLSRPPPLLQAPLAAAMLQGGSNKAAWTFGFHSAAAARAEEAKPAAGAEQAAAGSSNEEQQPEAETKVEMTLEECTAALTECQEALEGEKKKVRPLVAGGGLVWLDAGGCALAECEWLAPHRKNRCCANTDTYMFAGCLQSLLTCPL